MKPIAQAQKVTIKEENGHWVASCGSASLKIYPGKNQNGPTWTVVYYLAGSRRRDVRSTWEAAQAHAETVVKDLARGDAAIAPIGAQDRVAFVRAQAALASSDLPVDVAASQVAEALKRLGGRSLAEAVDYFAKHSPSVDLSKTCRQAADEFLAAKQADGRGFRHIKDLTLRLDKFCEAFDCPIASVTTQTLSGWLRGLKCAGRSRNNYRNAMRNFFSWAGAQGMIGADQINWDARQGVALAFEEESAIEIFTPEELGKLLAAAQINPNDLPAGFNRRYATAQGLLPYLVLGAFAGLRTSEICAQAWSDIDIEGGYLRVTRAKRNTPSRRLVPLSENCKAWLRLCRRSEGVCCNHARPEDPIQRLAERAGVPWKRNALRHSFISYRVAQVKNTPQVAGEAGNSPKMIDAHYRELVTEEKAKVWFAISPAAPVNVVPMVEKVA